MRAFTINLNQGNCTLTNSLTKEVIYEAPHRGVRATTETIKEQVFTEIMKRKIKGA